MTLIRGRTLAFRFSLRALFAVITVFALLLSLKAWQVQTMRDRVVKIQELGGSVWMSHQCTDDGRVAVGPFIPFKQYGGIRGWLKTVFESDFWQTVYCIDLSNTKVSNHDLEILQSFPDLRGVVLTNTAVDDDSVNYLANIMALRYVDLRSTNVTEHGVKNLLRFRPDIDVKCISEFDRLLDLLDEIERLFDLPEDTATSSDEDGDGFPAVQLIVDP